MAGPKLADVLSHWQKPFADFHTSPQDFYTAVEASLNAQEIPGISTDDVEYPEGGVLTGKREYLRVKREKLLFDLCAAPFGTGFFFSWWLAERKPSRWLALVTAGLVYLVYIAVEYIVYSGFGMGRIRIPYYLRAFVRPVFFLVVGVVSIALLALAARLTKLDVDDFILPIPLIGPAYRWLAKPDTYFRFDKAMMFQSAVHSSVLEVLEKLLNEKGVRALTDDEKKPILRDFLKR